MAGGAELVVVVMMGVGALAIAGAAAAAATGAAAGRGGEARNVIAGASGMDTAPGDEGL